MMNRTAGVLSHLINSSEPPSEFSDSPSHYSINSNHIIAG